jgi:predicted dehydrogenase
MERLSIGIIDCGSISPPSLRLAPAFRGLNVRAVADVNLAAAQARADELGTKAQSVEDLLANPAVDVVINLTIPDAHFVVSKAILQAG